MHTPMLILMLSQLTPQMEGEKMEYPLFLFFVLISATLCADPVPFAFFEPPTGWTMTSSRPFKEGMKIGFVESKRRIFAPSISLSVEKISCSEKEYLTSVQRAHGFDHAKEVRLLGTFETRSGRADLFQIDMKHTWGEIRILQAILIKEGYAHIQTAACLKSEFAKICDQLLKSFQSLRISSDFFSTIRNRKKLENSFNCLKMAWKRYSQGGDEKGADLFRERLFREDQWVPFVDSVKRDYRDLGICWQMLAIEHLKEELIRSTPA